MRTSTSKRPTAREAGNAAVPAGDPTESLSPFLTFPRHAWARLRDGMPMALTEAEIPRLRTLGDRLDLSGVEEVYLPLSRLLAMHVEAAQGLFRARRRFLGGDEDRVPFVIGIGGSVAVGKSTTARVLQALLARWPRTPRVALVTTDGFLRPNAELERRGLMRRKGFPESYDVQALLRFLSDVKAGVHPVRAPVYSHLTYDVIPGDSVTVDAPDILILEGVNVLHAGAPPRDGRTVPFVSDFLDFSVYLDAPEEALRRWYLDRFLALRDTAFRDPRSYFHRYARLSDADALATATGLWEDINLVNLRENILPTRGRADLILRKGEDHRVEEIALRRL
ncbi:type I pantothenate kinase [Roseomonas sp. CCTCC AB2023176]|uniref:type I pantothenate kinase n=1 Tax=Roseomonas sp. CCTCC AB2023176 TaxID=3342640 RepID=UPI0035DCF574